MVLIFVLLTHEGNTCVEKVMDPNSHKIHRRNSKLTYSQSKICHYHTALPALDHSLEALVALESNEEHLTQNNCLSIGGATMDFSVSVVFAPKNRKLRF